MTVCADTEAFLLQLIADEKRPAVFDADALNVIACNEEAFIASRKDCVNVLTPHEGEAARLLGHPICNRLSDAIELSQRYAAVVVLKGPETLVVQGEDKQVICTSAGPELAKAGTGDVLAGLLGGFLCQGLDAFDASALAVYVHAKCGALAAEKLSDVSVMPQDLVDYVGYAIKRFMEEEVVHAAQ